MTTETTARIAELNADAKQVYKVGPNGLLALADKYGVVTPKMAFMRSEPARIEGFASAGIAMFPSKSEVQTGQRMVYAAIKAAIREAQA